MKGWQLKEGDHSLMYNDFKPKGHLEQKVTLLASALNHRDVWITKGKYPGSGPGIVLGSDGVGSYKDKIIIINPGLSWGNSEKCQGPDFNILGIPSHGTFAEACFVPEQYHYKVPAHLSLFEAAALPLAGVTAYRALFKRGKLKKDQTVLVNGLGGGVALLAAQMAIALGCTVLGTSGSKWKREKAEELGVEKTYDYRDSEWAKKCLKDTGGADLIIDSAGGESFKNLLKIARPGGKIVTYGGTNGTISNISPQIIFWKQLSILGSTMGSDQDFQEMIDFVSQNKITPIIDEVIPLSEAPRGFVKMESAEQFGKIVFDHTN